METGPPYCTIYTCIYYILFFYSVFIYCDLRSPLTQLAASLNHSFPHLTPNIFFISDVQPLPRPS